MYTYFLYNNVFNSVSPLRQKSSKARDLFMTHRVMSRDAVLELHTSPHQSETGKENSLKFHVNLTMH